MGIVMKLAELLNSKSAVKTLTVNVLAEDMYVPEQCTATVGCAHADVTLLIAKNNHTLMMVAHASATVDFANNTLIDFDLLREPHDYICLSEIEDFKDTPYDLHDIDSYLSDNETLITWVKNNQRKLCQMSLEDFQSLPLTVHGAYSKE